MNKNFHNTSIVETQNIGKDTKVWHWTHICKNAVIGNNCSIGQNVYIANNVYIGNNCKIQNNVSIFDNVKLEDNVFCGPSVVFTNVSNPRSEFIRKNEYKDTVIKEGATLGANSTIICGNTIGSYAFIGAGSTITKDVPNFALFIGSPAKQVGWYSRYGQKLPLDLFGKKHYLCKFTKDKYKLINQKLIIER